MKLAIMQPYFFPYLGYLSLIKYSDFFIFFDTPQMMRHGWVERNRILKPQDGWQYIKAPLMKHSRNTLIFDVKINNEHEWGKKLIDQLGHYKKNAYYYKIVIELLKEVLLFETNSITLFNAHALKVICDYINIKFEYDFFSKMNLVIDKVEAPDEWALNISKKMGATEYVNPPNGKSFFNTKKYINSGIDITFLQNNLTEYNQNRNYFEPGLSIIDALMFCSTSDVRLLIDDYCQI